MAFLFFNQCPVRVNGNVVLAENATLNVTKPIQGVPSGGSLAPFRMAATDYLNGTANFTYYLNASDPLLAIVNESLFSGPNVDVVIGGITAPTGYITNYTLQGSSNEFIKVSVTVTFFGDLSGSLTASSATIVSTDFAHARNSSLVVVGMSDVVAFNYVVTQTITADKLIGELAPSKFLRTQKETVMSVTGDDLDEALTPCDENHATMSVSVGRFCGSAIQTFTVTEGEIITRNLELSPAQTVRGQMTVRLIET